MEKPEAVKLIESHRSIRKFLSRPVEPEMLETILHAARWAPTSHNMQSYSIIIIKNQETKNELHRLCGNQRYIKECPVFLVVCADFYKMHKAAEMHGQKLAVEELENILVGSVDAALVAQNLLLAARAYELGGVMIGGIRNQAEEVGELLKLPPYTFPVMGMCLGYPDQDPWQKPRMPVEAVFHDEHYREENIPAALEQYDKTMTDYYTRRTGGKRTSGWSKEIAAYISEPRRKSLTEYIRKQGFDGK